MQNIILYVQIAVSILLIVLILLQRRGGDAAGFMGGSSGGNDGFYQQRRGLEQFIFVATIILVIVFTGLALASVFYHEPAVTSTDELAPLVDTQETGAGLFDSTVTTTTP